jgi:hypothetical protein
MNESLRQMTFFSHIKLQYHFLIFQYHITFLVEREWKLRIYVVSVRERGKSQNRIKFYGN